MRKIGLRDVRQFIISETVQTNEVFVAHLECPLALTRAHLALAKSDTVHFECLMHPGHPVHARYEAASGAVVLTCPVCGEVVAEIAVA